MRRSVAQLSAYLCVTAESAATCALQDLRRLIVIPYVTFSRICFSLRRGRAALVLGPLLALLWLGAPALAATATAKPTSHRWVNYDTDQWGGSSQPSNPGYATNPQGCDPIDPASACCPIPTTGSPAPTPPARQGAALSLNVLAMPHNIAGKPIDPTAWNASDGFSAGSQILTVVPGMTKNSDLAASGLPTDVDMRTNVGPNLGVMLLDATTGKVWPTWTRSTSTRPKRADPRRTMSPVQQDLIIHPAKNLLTAIATSWGCVTSVTDNGTGSTKSAASTTYVRALPSPVIRAEWLDGIARDACTPHMEPIFENLQGGRLDDLGQPGGPVPSLGLHDGVDAERDRSAPGDPRRRVRATR